jgi:hypothetical protein
VWRPGQRALDGIRHRARLKTARAPPRRGHYRRYEDLDLRRIDLKKIDFGTIKSGFITEPPIGTHEVTEIAAVVA